MAVGALTVLRNTAARSHASRDAIRDAQGLLPMVVLLGAGPEREVTCLAAGALRNLARNHEGNRTAIREAGAVAPLIWLLDAGPQREVTAHACAALTNLAYHNSGTCELMRTAGGGGCIKPLVRLLLASEPCSDLAKFAAGAIANITWDNDGNCAALCDAGAVPPLIRIIKTPEAKEAAMFAVDALRNLARDEAARAAIREGGGIDPVRYPASPSSAVQCSRNSPAGPLTARDCAVLSRAYPRPPPYPPTPLSAPLSSRLRSSLTS